MPVLTPSDQVLLHVANCSAAQLLALRSQGTRNPFPVTATMRQVVSDRLTLAGDHLRAGDELLLGSQFRASIGRHYYAMYHGARAVTYAVTMGDDHERHSDLPRNLPATMANVGMLEAELTDARLLRNQADYDPYPGIVSAWEADARQLAGRAAAFLQTCEDFALMNGHI